MRRVIHQCVVALKPNTTKVAPQQRLHAARQRERKPVPTVTASIRWTAWRLLTRLAQWLQTLLLPHFQARSPRSLCGTPTPRPGWQSALARRLPLPLLPFGVLFVVLVTLMTVPFVRVLPLFEQLLQQRDQTLEPNADSESTWRRLWLVTTRLKSLHPPITLLQLHFQTHDHFRNCSRQ